MRVVFINKSDMRGGAAMVTLRLVKALRAMKIDARLLVAEKLGNDPFVHKLKPVWLTKAMFLLERLRIFTHNGFSRRLLFRTDCGSYGLPLWRHAQVRKADVVVLNWVNQGLLSIGGIKKIGATGKPLVWTMHDLWPMTGICHVPGNCRGYSDLCGDCPQLGAGAAPHDLSWKTWRRKRLLYDSTPIHFVAVSGYVRQRALAGELLANEDIDVIPNGLPVDAELPPREKRENGGTLEIVMGAARLDDPVKGLPVLYAAMSALRRLDPDLWRRTRLTTYGTLRDPHALDGIDANHRHLGYIHGEEELRKVFDNADIVLSTSRFETFGATLAEGMARGCIPVATDRGGQSDIIEHRQNGWLAPYSGEAATQGESIAEGIIWAASRTGADMRETCRRHAADNFSDTAVARRYAALFNRLLRQKH